MIEDFLTRAWWPGPVIGCVLLWIDYALTILGARRYRARIAPMHRFEGSYELTPLYQSDVDRLRVFSWRVVGVGISGLRRNARCTNEFTDARVRLVAEADAVDQAAGDGIVAQ